MDYFKKFIISIFMIFSLIGCAQKGKITDYKDRFTGEDISSLNLETISPRPLVTIKKTEVNSKKNNNNYTISNEKKEYRKAEKGEFSGSAILVRDSDKKYFLEITQPFCAEGKAGNLVVFLADDNKINSALSKDSIKNEGMIYTQYGAVNFCTEVANIGPLPKSFFDAAKTSEVIEFKIYNKKHSSISSLNKQDLQLITNFAQQ